MDDKSNIGLAIRNTRLKKNMSAVELCKLANIPRSSLSDWENGRTQPSAKSFIRIIEALNVSSLELIENGKEDLSAEDKPTSLPKNAVDIHKVKVPILGRIACGQPIYAEESFEGFISVDGNIHYDFGLWAQGDSMIDARIYDGDLVLIRKQDTVENGEIAAVMIDDEATLKRVYYDEQKGTMTLMAANPKYAPFVYHGSELNNIRILGKAVNFLGVVR